MSRTTDYTTPLPGTPYYTSTGIIKCFDENDAHFPIGEISYERFDDQNFQYVIAPYWNEIEHLPASIFYDIPGIDLRVKKDRYYRVNLTPTFIEMRTPGPGRADLWDLLSEVGLDYYDRFEWLLRSEKKCGDDNFIVVRKRESKAFSLSSSDFDLNNLLPGDTVTVSALSDIPATKPEFSYSLFRLLASGATIHLENEQRNLDAMEKRTMLYLLKIMQMHDKNYAALRQADGIRRAKEEGKYTGRKRQPVDPLLLEQVTKQFRSGLISEADAMKQLNINSRSTLYRRMREIS
ncbi:MAG: recombinase family protein [Lachnospiraceae bacterium]|nr:recombinase family protein [Lachnospiraceae bacterium]